MVEPTSPRTTFNHFWPGSTDPNQCIVSLEYDLVAGRVEPVVMTVRMTAAGGALTTSLLRQLPVGTWVAEDRKTHRARAMWKYPMVEGLLTKAQQKEIRQARLATESAEPGRPRVSYDLLVEVARVYRREHQRSDAPTQAVADHFDRPRSTAAKWVQRAREEGLLGPTEPRKAGELRPKRRRRT